MSLSSEEIYRQTRALWATCFPGDTPDFLDLYFSRRYTAQRNLTLQKDEHVVVAGQLLPFKFTLSHKQIPVGYISGLCTDPNYRQKGWASQWISQAHRRMYKEGNLISFLIPGDAKLRQWYENPLHGAYSTVSNRISVPLAPQTHSVYDLPVEITRQTECTPDLWKFYNTFGGRHDYEIRHDRDSFETAILTALIEGATLLVARRKHNIIGFCLSVKETQRADSEPQIQNAQIQKVRFMLTTDERLIHIFSYQLRQLTQEEVFMNGGCPIQGFKSSLPYGMARIVDVPRFLRMMALVHPGLQMTVGVREDKDLPENNGNYEICDGQVHIATATPSNIVTPGGLAVLFLGSQAVQMPLMLDE